LFTQQERELRRLRETVEEQQNRERSRNEEATKLRDDLSNLQVQLDQLQSELDVLRKRKQELSASYQVYLQMFFKYLSA
jgi:uncharacterized coiled-coil DUF342 family protein